MIAKYPINVPRLRKVPKQFNWVDHRLVGDRHIDTCSVPAAKPTTIRHRRPRARSRPGPRARLTADPAGSPGRVRSR